MSKRVSKLGESGQQVFTATTQFGIHLAISYFGTTFEPRRRMERFYHSHLFSG